MLSKYSINIAPFVKAELKQAEQAENPELEFRCLENAHVLGQESTYWHVKVHWLMLLWAVRNLEMKEVFGQIFRIVGAATKTAIGLVPAGNTGGANVSPFKRMPIKREHQAIIEKVKSEQ